MYLRLGQPFMGNTPEPDKSAFRSKLLRDWLKRLWLVWTK
jgi:hypothetical protein